MVSATAPTLPSAQASVEGIASGRSGAERERLEHALAFAQKLARKSKKGSIILVNLSGRGDKDVAYVQEIEGVRI